MQGDGREGGRVEALSIVVIVVVAVLSIAAVVAVAVVADVVVARNAFFSPVPIWTEM